MWISSDELKWMPFDLVDHVAQQIAADHAVADAGEDGGDDVAAVVAVGALKAAEVGEQARPFVCRRAGRLPRG